MRQLIRQIEEVMKQLDFIASGIEEDSYDASVFRAHRNELEVYYAVLRVRKLTRRENRGLRDLLGILIKFLSDWYTSN